MSVVVWNSAVYCFLPMCHVGFLWSQNWVFGITVLCYYCSCMKLSKVTRKDHGCVWPLIRTVTFFSFPKRPVILKHIIMGKIPLFHHGVTGRLSYSTRLEPLPLISTCILYLKPPPYFLSVPATQHHPVPPWPFPLHITTTSAGLPFMSSFLA